MDYVGELSGSITQVCVLGVNYVGGRRYQYYGAGELSRWMTQVNCLG